MSGTGWAIVATVALIALSAFFVAVEFALLAAKRHRLADAAPRSRSARAAVRSSAELTVVLAGSQLGITACTLALGAVTKPAVQDLLAGPGLEEMRRGRNHLAVVVDEQGRFVGVLTLADLLRRMFPETDRSGLTPQPLTAQGS